jgi:hypothetical protein
MGQRSASGKGLHLIGLPAKNTPDAEGLPDDSNESFSYVAPLTSLTSGYDPLLRSHYADTALRR